MRKCHLGTCPVGIATQDMELRKRFAGKPEYVVRFLTFVAEEVRRIMAQLGFRKFDDMVGRVERLSCRKAVDHWKAKGLDFSALFRPPDQSNGCAHCVAFARKAIRIKIISIGKSWKRWSSTLETKTARAAGHADPQTSIAPWARF